MLWFLSFPWLAVSSIKFRGQNPCSQSLRTITLRYSEINFTLVFENLSQLFVSAKILHFNNQSERTNPPLPPLYPTIKTVNISVTEKNIEWTVGEQFLKHEITKQTTGHTWVFGWL